MSVRRTIRAITMAALACGAAALLAGCEETGSTGNNDRAYAAVPTETVQLMAAKGTSADAPMLIRAYKKEAELEVWKRKADGKYVFLKTFPMCRWSGQLGPKVTEGDRQVPEGFYTITPGQMNPNSHYYLSFNVGYPNAYDRANGHTGGSIMVHGICSSAGCFSMTDKAIEEIYAIARESFAGGQRAIQMQSYPFKMTAENFAKLRLDPNMPFWRELKKGADHFELTKTETPVGVCNKHYVFGATPQSGRFDALSSCPPLNEDESVKALVSEKETRDNSEIAALVAKGIKPVRIIYADGGQNEEFAHRFVEVSRPDALAAGPTEIVIEQGAKSKSALVQIAAAKAQAKALLAKGNVITSNVAVAEGSAKQATPAPTAVASIAATTTAAATTLVPQTKTAQADVPGAFAAAPSAYAANAPADEGPGGFFKKWLSFGGGAAKPEAAPAIQISEPGAPQPTAVPLPPRRSMAAGTVKPLPAHDLAPAKSAVTKPALPKELMGDRTASLPSSALALTPSVN